MQGNGVWPLLSNHPKVAGSLLSVFSSSWVSADGLLRGSLLDWGGDWRIRPRRLLTTPGFQVHSVQNAVLKGVCYSVPKDVQTGWIMMRTATVTELRSELASYLASLREGPLLVLSHSKPAAMLIEPEEFDRLIERVEFLEDLLDGRQAVAEYLEDPSVAADAEEILGRIGQ